MHGCIKGRYSEYVFYKGNNKYTSKNVKKQLTDNLICTEMYLSSMSLYIYIRFKKAKWKSGVVRFNVQKLSGCDFLCSLQEDSFLFV